MNEYLLLLSVMVAFLITVLASPVFIPFLKRLKFGQSIREEGPKSHMKKTGTPTMGGVMIILSIVIVSLFMMVRYSTDRFSIDMLLLLLVLVGYGVLGFLDDFIKVVLKRNLGLTSKQKLIGQLLIAVIFYLLMLIQGVNTTITLPATSLAVDLSLFYPLLVILMIVGTSNAVNLTDGLDGLVSGIALFAFFAFGLLATIVSSNMEVAIFSFSVVGALLGFLMFNAHPAKVFMGDTGSLALGAALSAVAIILKLEVLLVIIGGVFVIETLSVMIQVVSYKLRGKRVFLMSPIHHHFELKGWSEWRVVTTFWAMGLILAVIGFLLEVWI
ncbi:Phospho-N-acetylmuramoyl-pentapeptide-transferase [Pelagirhabdus alkalitolerans]|uniref:Phospho-N-acetylmuramoyl-pentapeptide-transferase n=1 Tax=Pelagirhabdus alkalitolerans TaxID=1612202 RepID=A0A1G6GZR9_9BACI|nr:phospho-N-acetylmuramoyl-pentapeptide-transferase [Pelagirhabdus alkalitolerans]SDB87560.1 Phospho-N-acetylmuramoyl-pentapeptide-transferase [Pelagirhabdus alkalitolerans]